MDRKTLILKLFYDDKYTASEIAKQLNVSNAYITKVINKDSRYYDEKIQRRNLNKQKNINQNKEYMRKKREEKIALDAIVKKQHIQAVSELSAGKAMISNRAFREWNKSAYRYNEKKKCYEFDKKLGKSYAIPRYIKIY